MINIHLIKRSVVMIHREKGNQVSPRLSRTSRLSLNPLRSRRASVANLAIMSEAPSDTRSHVGATLNLFKCCLVFFRHVQPQASSEAGLVWVPGRLIT